MSEITDIGFVRLLRKQQAEADIVWRLRSWDMSNVTDRDALLMDRERHEAADEIERLRASLK